MMKIFKSVLLITLLGIGFSCADDSLDPLKFKEVKKGTILALRGTQLENIYFKAIPGALFVPGLLDGTETFDFDAEYLSADPNSLASLDIYVLKKNGSSFDRVSLTNVPASEFKTTDDYPNPWVSVSISIDDILTKIGITPNYPLSASALNTLFVDYKNGINIETDVNLTDGSKVLAADLVAAGLYQSNQFYPAQKLNYAVIKYCNEDLEGTYDFYTVVTAGGGGVDISGCAGGVSGSGELIKLEGAYGTYSIPDVSFGQYDCAWGDNPATGATLINTCDEITVGGDDQYGLVYTFSNLSVSPDGTQMTFNWENDYGDKGTTTLTRTDSKLWPTTLYTGG
jgi:hypothetical protein